MPVRFRSSRRMLSAAATLIASGLVAPASAASETGPVLVVVKSSPNPYALGGSTAVAHSVGVVGSATGSSGVGLYGRATQPGSVGTAGFASSTEGATSHGIFGYAANGDGVFGATDSSTYAGIFGTSSSAGGTGVYGKAQGYGVYGESNAFYGVFGVTRTTCCDQSAVVSGIYGLDGSSGGNQIGVMGYSAQGLGVMGSSSGGVGVQGQSEQSPGVEGWSSEGAAIAGYDAYPSAGFTGYGIFGSDSSNRQATASEAAPIPPWAGVYGSSTRNYGVIGETQADSTIPIVFAGVLGVDRSANFNQVGVLGYSAGGAALAAYGHVGILAESLSAAPAIEAIGEGNGNVFEAFARPRGNEILNVDTGGNLTLAGTLTTKGTPQSTIRDARGIERVVYGARQTQSTMEDFGEAQMVNGRAYVPLDPNLSGVLDPASSYIVFISPEGPNAGTYVTGKSLHGFTVREMSGRATMTFGYRIVGRPRADQAEGRLAAYHPMTDRVALQANFTGRIFRPVTTAVRNLRKGRRIPHVTKPPAIPQPPPVPTMPRLPTMTYLVP